jgi:putative phage-type endonuclease
MTQTLNTHGIGASEIAAIIGLNPYASPWDIWLRKTGQAPDVDQTEAMEWGLRLEPAIRQKYADTTRLPLYVPSESLFRPGVPWARATPDAIALADQEPLSPWTHLVQCKNVGYWPGKEWDETPPAYVQLQEQWEMYVTDLPRADIAALIAGGEYRVYTVHRDSKLIGDLVELATQFWARVESRTPPAVDSSTACRDHFARRLVDSEVVELPADSDLEQAMADWKAERAALKASERRVETLRNTVLSALESAQADRLVSSIGVAKLARYSAKTHQETDWRLVAQLLASAPNPAAVFAELVEANTKTITTPPSVALREPSWWSREKKQ